MRFRKLKIFVGIALVVFILVIGNIYAFGLLKKSTQTSDSNLSPPVYLNKSPAVIQPSQQSGSSTQSQQTTTQPAAPPQNTIIHNFFTRAS